MIKQPGGGVYSRAAGIRFERAHRCRDAMPLNRVIV